MITPKELEELDMKLDELEKKIDRSIKNYHGIASSEHGDRPGLTRFIFSMEKPDDKAVCGFYIA